MLGILLEYWIKNIIGIFVIGSIVFDVKCYVGISKFKNIRNRVNNEWGWKDILEFGEKVFEKFFFNWIIEFLYLFLINLEGYI